jgi:hypothetical protein
MSNLAKATKATLIPCLRYRDAPAAIDWLAKVFASRSSSWSPTLMARSLTPSSASAMGCSW